MIKDNTNHYYTVLLDSLQEQYSGMDGSKKNNDSPPTFPYMYFRQIDGTGALRTLSGTEMGVNLAYEIHFYSKKSPNDVRNIANAARKIMVETLGFNCSYFQPENNVSDSSINQFITRFTKLETD